MNMKKSAEKKHGTKFFRKELLSYFLKTANGKRPTDLERDYYKVWVERTSPYSRWRWKKCQQRKGFDIQPTPEEIEGMRDYMRKAKRRSRGFDGKASPRLSFMAKELVCSFLKKRETNKRGNRTERNAFEEWVSGITYAHRVRSIRYYGYSPTEEELFKAAMEHRRERPPTNNSVLSNPFLADLVVQYFEKKRKKHTPSRFETLAHSHWTERVSPLAIYQWKNKHGIELTDSEREQYNERFRQGPLSVRAQKK